MSERLLCVHGHSLDGEGPTTAIKQLCCPLCGTAIKGQKVGDGFTGALDVTFVPNSVRLSSLMDRETAVMGGDTADAVFPDPQTLSVDAQTSDNTSRDADALAPTKNLTSEQLAEAERNMAAAEVLRAESLRKSKKPPSFPGIEVIDELGRGGFGVVYRAFDEKHKREVALKTLQRMGPIDLVRFKNEFRALVDIAHPNLASLYELVSDGQTWCFTMEILDGVNFLEYVWSEFESLKHESVKSSAPESSIGPIRKPTFTQTSLEERNTSRH